MKRIICMIAALLLLSGCAAPRPEDEQTAAVPEPAVTAAPEEPEPEATEAPEPETTEAPETSEPAAEQEPERTAPPPQYPYPQPVKPDAFTAETPEQACEALRAHLSAYPCYVSPGYEVGTFDQLVSYDAARGCVCLKITSLSGEALITAVNPLLATGKIDALELDTSDGYWPETPLKGLKTLTVTQYDPSETPFLANCTAVTALTVGQMAQRWFSDLPPAIQTLTVESARNDEFDLSAMGGDDNSIHDGFRKLTTLTVGVKGVNESTELSGTADTLARMPALTTVNLYVEQGETTGEIFRGILAATNIQTFNGRKRTAYGAFFGCGNEGTTDRIEQILYPDEDGASTVLPATEGLPDSITGSVYVLITSENNGNMENDSDITYNSTDAYWDYYGIPRPLLWQEDAPESDCTVAYIYERDIAVGTADDERFAVETRLVLVRIATGEAWQTTVATRQPPKTGDDTYGAYCPLAAVEQVRKLLKTDLGPYAGLNLDEAQSCIEDYLDEGGSCYAKEGLPAAVTGPIAVRVIGQYANVPDGQEIDDSDSLGEDGTYYGIPADRILQSDGDGSQGWLAIIGEISRQTKTYTGDYDGEIGYTVDTRLVLVELATGRAYQTVIASSAPPAVPDETSYGEFYPARALDALKKLL